MLLGGLVAGQGKIDVVTLIGDRLGLRGRRRPRRASSSAAASAARSWSGTARKVQITEERLQRSRGSSTATAARRSSSGASSASSARSRRSWRARAGMPLRRFLPYDVIGAGLWGDDVRPARLRLLAELRHASSTTPKQGRARARRDVIVLVVGIVWLVRWLRHEEHRRQPRELARPPARAAAAAAVRRASCAPSSRGAPRPARFVVGPRHAGRPRARAHDAAGGRGGRGVRVRRAHRPARRRGRRSRSATATAYDLAERLEAAPLVDVAKVVTLPRRRCRSSLVLVLGAIVLPALRAARSSRRSSLAVGMALTYAGVHITQGGDRPPAARPTRSSTPTGSTLSVGPRGVRGRVGRGRGHAEPRAARPRVAVRRRHGRGRARGRRSALTPRLPARALAQRRHRRRGPGARRCSRCAGIVALVVAHVRHNGRSPATVHGMTNDQIIYLVAIGSGVARPDRLRRVHPRPRVGRLQPRLGARGRAFLTLYVLAAFVVLGVGGRRGDHLFWDRIGT